MQPIKRSPIVRDPEILGGSPVFRNSRVPIATLFDYLETGETLEQFLEDFPSVRHEVAIEVLEDLREIALTLP
ncbi:MAG: DUF433 domain-containing protein [Anaerolineae bacterium]|nr:DUF433 domain-containing protein [Anaerolineae bacterium]